MFEYKVPTCDVPGCHGHLAKFDDCVSEMVWEWSLDGADRSTGDVDFQGYYAAVTLDEPETVTMDDGQPDAYPVPVPAGHYVVFCASGGGVTVVRYDTAEEVAAIMDAEEDAYAKWMGDDGDEGGIPADAMADGHRYVMGAVNSYCPRCSEIETAREGRPITSLSCEFDRD